MILAYSGRRLSGKNTCCSYIKQLIPEAEEFSFAYSLKRMAVDILGLREEQAYGTDEEKDSLVEHLLWENFPLPAWVDSSGNITVQHTPIPPQVEDFRDLVSIYHNQNIKREIILVDGNSKIDLHRWVRKTGPMTGREVLQYFGTNIYRKIYGDVWVDACIRQIKKSEAYKNGYPCCITDTRFPNECEGVQKAGGKVIRLTRVLRPQDSHVSETALDRENFDWSKFDAILENDDLDISAQCEELYDILFEMKAIDYVWPNERHAAAAIIEQTHKMVTV